MPDRSPSQGSRGYTGGADAASASRNASAGAAYADANSTTGGATGGDRGASSAAAAAAAAGASSAAAAAAAAASRNARQFLTDNPDDLYNKATSENNQAIQIELDAFDKDFGTVAHAPHPIPDSVTELQYDDTQDEDGNDKSKSGYSPKDGPNDNEVLTGEDEAGNEYFAMQQKAFRVELDEEKSRDANRQKLLRIRNINRKKSFGASGVANSPTWFDNQNPLSKAEIIKHYSTWSSSRSENKTFSACWWELSENFTDAGDKFKKPEGQSLFGELGKTVAGAAIGVAKEAVMNLGMAVSDQIAGIENNAANALSAAVDKALTPIIRPVANFVQDVKDKIYGAIESGAKKINDGINSVLGVNQDVTEIKTYSVPAYILEVGKDIEASQQNPAYSASVGRTAEAYHKAIVDEVKKVLEENVTAMYGALSQSRGATEESGVKYKTIDKGLINSLVDQYFVSPLMDATSGSAITEASVPSLNDSNTKSTSTFLASSLHSPLSNQEAERDLGGNGPEDTYDVFNEVKAHTEDNSEIYFARVLQQAAKDAKALEWEAATVLCSTGKTIENKTVMALMDSTVNRYNVLLKATSLFEKTTMGQMTMEAINTYKPSQLINRFMFSQDSSNGGMGDVLLAATALMGPGDDNFERKWDGKYLNQIKNLHKGIFRSESNIGCAPGLVWCLSEFDTRDYDNGIILGSSTLLWSILDQKGAVNVLSSLMSFHEEKSEYFDKVGTIVDTSNKNAPKPMWSHLREGRALYGEESLASMFRVNKTIPSGEIDYFQNGLYHLFFVKPDLNLTENAMALMGYHNHPLAGEIITQLNYNNNDLMPSWSEFPPSMFTHRGAHPYFSYLLSNLVKSTSIPDLSLDVKEGWENTFGGRTQFGVSTRKSNIGNDFSISFYDTKELLLMNIITAWMKYIEVMKEGQGDCSRKMSTQGTIDYLGAMYYFVMEPDNHTIAHWGRYVGIFPTSAPWSAVKLEGGTMDIPEFSVNFKSEYHEANDPNILLDFNYIMRLPAYMGSTNSGNSNAYTKYARLSSIYTSRGHRSTNDPNLVGGPTRSENRAYVRMIAKNEASYKSDIGEKWGFGSKVPFKFLLEFESNMNGATVDEKMAEDTGYAVNKNEIGNYPFQDVTTATLSNDTSTEMPTAGMKKIVKYARIEPNNIYDPDALIFYFTDDDVLLPEKYGSGEALNGNWALSNPSSQTDRSVKDGTYGVTIRGAVWSPPDTGTKHGKDQAAAQKRLGGLADSNSAGRVDMASVGKTFGY